MKQAVLVLDGDMFLHKSLHVESLKRLENSNGEKTGIIFGVLKSVLRLLECFRDLKIKHICFCVSTGNSFRVQIESTYKHRTEKDRLMWTEHKEELGSSLGVYFKTQKEILKKLLPLFGVKVFSEHGYEADDIASFLSQLEFNSETIKILVSDDYDWCHLINESVHLFRFSKEDYITKENFKETLGIETPELHCLYLAMVGGHDNIKGVLKGFGEVSVKKMLSGLESANVESVVNWAKNQTGKAKELSNEETISKLKTNLQLVNLLGIDFPFEFRMKMKSILNQKLEFKNNEIFDTLRRYEFKSLLRMLDSEKFRELFF